MVFQVNIAELSMRRVISMTKQVAAFRALPQEDQIQLLKTGSIELLILRSVITFDKVISLNHRIQTFVLALLHSLERGIH